MFLQRPHVHVGDGGYISGWVVAIGFAVAFALLIVAVVVSLRRKRRKK